MTDQQIIELAKQAGMVGDATPAVIEFVRNLIEAERSACIKALEDLDAWNMDDPASSATKAIRARVRDKV